MIRPEIYEAHERILKRFMQRNGLRSYGEANRKMIELLDKLGLAGDIEVPGYQEAEAAILMMERAGRRAHAAAFQEIWSEFALSMARQDIEGPAALLEFVRSQRRETPDEEAAS